MAKQDIDLREPEIEPSFWTVALAVSLAFNAVILVGVAPGKLWPSGSVAVEQPVATSPLSAPDPEAPPETQLASVPVAPEPEPMLPAAEPAVATSLAAPEPAPEPTPAPAAVHPKPKPRPAKPAQSAVPRQPDPPPPEPVAMPGLPPTEAAPPTVVAVAPPPPPAAAAVPAREDDFLPPEMRHRAQLAIGPFRMSMPSWRPLPAAMTR